MKRTGIFFGSSTGTCHSIAEMIRADLQIDPVDLHDIAHAAVRDLMVYHQLILGVSTWEDGTLQEDWNHILPEISRQNLSDKKIALYGLGDQVGYSEHFADALGILYDVLLPTRCTFCGFWPADDYLFMRSKAYQQGKFVGLVIDEESQSPFTKLRVKRWTEQLRDEFGLR